MHLERVDAARSQLALHNLAPMQLMASRHLLSSCDEQDAINAGSDSHSRRQRATRGNELAHDAVSLVCCQPRNKRG